MNITAEQIIEFVINHGNEHGVTMKNVEVVGIETCVEQAPCCGIWGSNTTVYDVLSRYFSRNFKCALMDAIAYKNAKYIIDIVEYFGGYDDEYGYDYEVMGGEIIYCNSIEEMKKETERLKKESDIGYLVYDKSKNVIEKFNWHPLF